MNRIFLLAITVLSFSAKAASLEEFYYQLPILMCHDTTYLACRNGESVSECTKGLVKYREGCSAKELDTMDALTESMGCMVLKHAKVETIEEFEKKCEGGMNINISKAKERVEMAEPSWVFELLQ